MFNKVERPTLLLVCSATTWIFMSHLMIQSLVSFFSYACH